MHTEHPKQLILDHLDLVVRFFEHSQTPQVYLVEAERLARLIKTCVPEARLIMGSGYPYYVLDVEDPTIPEYRRFFSEIKRKAELLGDYFACPSCVTVNSPLSLRSFCSPCKTPLNAMDVLRSRPDIDLIMVVDQYDETTQQKVENVLRDNRYYLPDRDFIISLKETDEFMRSVLKDDPEDQRKGSLHPDVYFLRTDDYRRAYQTIGDGDLERAKVQYLALRRKWTVYRDDFAEDLFMSRHYPPFTIRDEELYSFAQQQTAKFAQSRTLEEVYNRFMNFLKHGTDGKNYRIATSSPYIMAAIRKRIEAYRSP